MLDLAKLKAPPEHGQVLVAPGPAECAAAARANAKQLRRLGRPLAGARLAQWREQTRRRVVGTDEAMVIAVGHQPEFFHPGVWAKHIAAVRLARILDGRAVNLVVDNDAVHRTVLPVPSVRRDGVRIENVRFLPSGNGLAYEQIPAQGRDGLGPFRSAVQHAMGNRFEASLMPAFLDGLDEATGQSDWVEQMLFARRRAEADLSVRVGDRRVSGLWMDPFVADILLNAARFAGSYNRALASYRSEFGVRGANQPIPDLEVDPVRCETPFWILRGDQPRRRLLVEANADAIHLYAEGNRVGSVPRGSLEEGRVGEAICLCDGWQIRPRALALTIWARLFLADLFIHGLGGARYDRISDGIIADYYGVEPPAYACVTATLWLDLPRTDVTDRTIGALRRGLREMMFNPQRRLSPAPDIEPLLAQRAAAVERSRRLREADPGDHAARRRAFETIRRANSAMLAVRPEALSEWRRRLETGLDELRRNRLARSREYFFALYGRDRLQELLEALPADRDFRV
jgi:hypothetical protein